VDVENRFDSIDDAKVTIPTLSLAVVTSPASPIVPETAQATTTSMMMTTATMTTAMEIVIVID
jgi:hypothetical protein